jgi:hypothetical protein
MLLKAVIIDVRQSGSKGLFGCSFVVNRFVKMSGVKNRFRSVRRIGAVIRSAVVD